MNTGPKKLNEILGNWKIDSSWTGIGYIQGASSSKDKGKCLFVKDRLFILWHPLLIMVHPRNMWLLSIRMCKSPNLNSFVTFVGSKGILDHTAIKEEINWALSRGSSLLLLNRSRQRLSRFVSLICVVLWSTLHSQNQLRMLRPIPLSVSP